MYMCMCMYMYVCTIYTCIHYMCVCMCDVHVYMCVCIYNYTCMCVSVFDKLIWCTIGPKSFLFGTAQFFQMAQLIIIILSLTALTLC